MEWRRENIEDNLVIYEVGVRMNERGARFDTYDYFQWQIMMLFSRNFVQQHKRVDFDPFGVVGGYDAWIRNKFSSRS